MNSLDNYHIDDSEISELKLEKIQLLRENIFKQIIKSLIHKNYKNLVLRICTYLDDTEGIFETYNKILNGDMKIDERKMILEDYAMYSMHHGELALARQQLRKRLNLEN